MAGEAPGNRCPQALGSRDTGRAMSQENVEAIKRVYEQWARKRKVDLTAFHGKPAGITLARTLEDALEAGPGE
jgi:hypothetical protein